MPYLYNLLLFFWFDCNPHLSGKLCRIGRDTDGRSFAARISESGACAGFDLGESPALVAIALNLIVSAILVP